MAFIYSLYIIKLIQQNLYLVFIFTYIFSILLIYKTFMITIQRLCNNQEIRNVKSILFLKRFYEIATNRGHLLKVLMPSDEHFWQFLF